MIREIEFLCYNSDYPDSTPYRSLIHLFRALKQKKFLVYMQDFSEGNTEQHSLAVIYSTYAEKREILKLAHQYKVEIDNDTTMDPAILKQRLQEPNVITESTLLEKKDHIIRDMPNLSPEEKKQVIEYFNFHPNEEAKIDWNKADSLTFADFKPLLGIVSKTKKKKDIKQTGIKGLIEGEDYVTVFSYEYITPGTAITGTIMGYSPLTWDASKFIASGYIGDSKTTGEWCVAYQKDKGYWNKYCGDEDNFFIFFVDYNAQSAWGKVAVQVFPSDRYKVWNAGDSIIYSSIVSQGTSMTEREYPEFLFDPSKMDPIIKKARKLIADAGGVQSEQTRYYSISVSAYGEAKSDTYFEGTVSYEQMSSNTDGDYDVEDTGDETTYSKFTIFLVGSDIDMEDLPELDDLQTFHYMNGVGVYVVYDNDRTPSDAYDNANSKWEGEMDSEPDMYDIEREIKKVLPEGERLDYIIVQNDITLDTFVKDILADYFTFYDKVNRNYDYGGGTVYEIITDRDSEGHAYGIIYQKDFDFTKGTNDWVSLPSQRKLDRQQDLEFGL